MRYSTHHFVLLAALTLPTSGCVETAVKLIAKTQQQGDRQYGSTFYLGGAGPVGNVGSLDVPKGLYEAGYEGLVDVFTWQTLTHAGDQINLSRNRSKAAELATEIKQYRRRYPDQEINVIALSAGTGIAAFALEYLPEGIQVDHAIFLGCSLSSNYDLTRALRRVRSGLYAIYSDSDPILRNVVWYTGTMDRSSAEEGVAGLEGFRLPAHKGPDTERQYAKLHNVPYRYEFSEYGYEGGHTDSTRRDFIREFIAPVVMGKDKKLLGEIGTRTTASLPPGRPRAPAPTSQKTQAPSAKPSAAPAPSRRLEE